MRRVVRLGALLLCLNLMGCAGWARDLPVSTPGKIRIAILTHRKALKRLPEAERGRKETQLALTAAKAEKELLDNLRRWVRNTGKKSPYFSGFLAKRP